MLSLNLLGRYQQLGLHQGHQAATPAQVFLSEERELFVRFCLVTRDFFVIFHLTATTLLARCCTDFLNLLYLFCTNWILVRGWSKQKSNRHTTKCKVGFHCPGKFYNKDESIVTPFMSPIAA